MTAIDAKLTEWASEEILVVVENPSADHATFLAQIAEFNLSAEGDTLAAAIRDLLKRLDTFVYSFVENDLSLPPRAGNLPSPEEPVRSNA